MTGFNPETLLGHAMPEQRSVISKHGTALYALSCGLGIDPMDQRQLDYVDFHRDLRVLPSMATILGYPGQFLADPALGVDTGKIVHGEQSVTLHASLPHSGTIIGQNRVTGITDKGTATGALLYTERVLTEAETGSKLATLNATIVLRGNGGFGGSAGAMMRPLPPTPEREPDLVIDLPTRPEQALYYRLNGDENPLHADPAFAARAGFPRPILHGLCSFGVICHALVANLCDYDAARLIGIGCRFSSPVFPGETIRTEIWRAETAFRARVVPRDARIATNGFFRLYPPAG
jgi:acyl dehydratase